MNPETLAERLAPLFAGDTCPVGELGVDAGLLAALGFEIRGGFARIPSGVERLDAAEIRAALTVRARSWLQDLETREIVGSTSTLLNELSVSRSIDGMVKMAELQVQGRGRRGRSWVSPYGNNLAISLGARLPQTPEQVGGFSLCIGLALADRLREAGGMGVELKWPNDVLIEGRKIAGVLIELHSRDGGTEVVVGVGVNYRLPPEARATIDQPVTDLLASGIDSPRNRLAAGVISSIVDYVDGFAANGFEPMSDMFNRLHRYHGRDCRVELGGEVIDGVVRGVTERGELLLDTRTGIRAFGAGEVSLREAPL